MRTLFAIVAILVASGAADAFANPLAPPKDASAFEKLKEGNRYYQLRDFPKAVEAYRAGYLIEPSPLFLYNLAQSFRFMKRFEDSIEHYKSFLREANPDGQVRAAVEGFIKEQSEKLEQKLEAKRIEAERRAREEREAARRQPPSSPQSSPERDTPPWYQDTLGWSLAGSGAIVLGVGIGLFVNGSFVRGDAENETSQAAADELFRRADTRQLVGGAASVVGAGLAIAGVIRLLSVDSPASGVALSAGSDHLSVSLGGRF